MQLSSAYWRKQNVNSMGQSNAVVSTMRCSEGRGAVGLRVEEIEASRWAVTWSFPLPERNEFTEEAGTISGSVELASGLVVCPRCEADSFFLCGGCSRLTCYRTSSTGVTRCSWCGIESHLEGEITSLPSGKDA